MQFNNLKKENGVVYLKGKC